MPKKPFSVLLFRSINMGSYSIRSFPFNWATPDNLFLCQICEGPVPVEYKCLFKFWEKGVEKGANGLDFLYVAK